MSATFALTAGVVDGVWWWTARSNARVLAGALNRQIIGQVKADVASLIEGAEAAYAAIETTLVRNVIDVDEEDRRETVFLAQLHGRPTLSWVAFGRPDGSLFAVHQLGAGRIDMLDVPAGPRPRQERVATYGMVGGASVQRQDLRPTDFDLSAQPWYRDATSAPSWTLVSEQPDAARPSVAYAGRVASEGGNRGVLAVMIDLSRLSRFLAGLKVGRTGAAFVLDARGTPVASPAAGSEAVPGVDPTLLSVARKTHDLMLAGADPAAMDVSGARVGWGGREYAVTVTPLGFMDWELTTVVPEADFLGDVDATNLRVSGALVALALCATAASAQLARHLLVTPLARVVEHLGSVRRLELDAIRHAPARLSELDLLSRVIADMAAGLSAFRRYLPADLVAALANEGIEARPGGTVQAVTVLFADVQGFTGISEAMGEGAFALLTRYFEVVSAAVAAHGGTIDKFIGDGVMAFWGAPNPDPDQAAAACRAALACVDGLAAADVRDHLGCPLVVRVGVNSGDALVGNVGTARRLNYTAIGDAVNVASRLEDANKAYGTSIILGDATRRRIGDAFVVRRLDRVALRGRTGETDVHELLGPAEVGVPAPAWVRLYEEALALHLAGRHGEAAAGFSGVIAMRGGDAPSSALLEHCGSPRSSS